MNKISHLLAPLFLVVTFGVQRVQAQPIAAQDGTGTVITSSDGQQFNITGGTQAGSNLFHSLQKLGLNENQIANFLSNSSVKNILSRVVGGEASIIDGLVKVTGGNSNLYLINPAGIIFGPNASLDVPAAFTATTANGIQIGDFWFKAMGSNDYTNLVGTPNGFAFTGDQSGSIINAANPLEISEEKSITLAGGIVINTGTFLAPGGNISISAVEGGKFVRISQEGSLLSLELPVAAQTEINSDVQPFTPLALPELLRGGNISQNIGLEVNNEVIRLTNSESEFPHRLGSIISAGTSTESSTSDGGNINLQASQLVVTGDLNSSGSNGGDVLIDAGGVIKTDAINSSGSSGNGGQVNLKNTTSFPFNLFFINPGGDITTATINSSSSSGDGGQITLEADLQIITDDLNSSGINGGDILINADGAIETGAIDSSGSFGDGGLITLFSFTDIVTGTLNSSGSNSGKITISVFTIRGAFPADVLINRIKTTFVPNEINTIFTRSLFVTEEASSKSPESDSVVRCQINLDRDQIVESPLLEYCDSNLESDISPKESIPSN